MKVSISLPPEDVAFLDDYARKRERSRSGAVHEAIDALRRGELAEAYERAWDEWDAREDRQLWDRTSTDGL